VLLEQIRTIDKTRLKQRVSELDNGKMEEINRAILISLGFV
ncbi:MAG: type II toxin-antitoxin system PemK/MazF family toxin, partial [Clostridia bacterium]|nr:type II toxin-antitoxin system PemK/MazF family toxin [Clostridia bacterium]